MPFRKKDFIKTMELLFVGFGLLAGVLAYYSPETWTNDPIRVALALTLLIFAMSALLAHHVTLEIDRLIESINPNETRRETE